jgi:FXSXX-COOH protein
MDVDMDRVGPDVERNLASLDDLPLAQMVAMYENEETVLANSIQRVLDAARSDPRDTVAAFNNYV